MSLLCIYCFILVVRLISLWGDRAGHWENVCGCTDTKKKKLSRFLAAAVDSSDAPWNGGMVGVVAVLQPYLLHWTFDPSNCNSLHKQAVHLERLQIPVPALSVASILPLDKSNRYFHVYLCGYTPYSLTHFIKNTQEAETHLKWGWGMMLWSCDNGWLWVTMTYCCTSESEGDLQENRKLIRGIKQGEGNKWKVSQWAVRSLFSRCFDCLICIHGFSLERWDSWTRHSREKGEINILQMLRWRLMEEVVSGEVLH